MTEWPYNQEWAKEGWPKKAEDIWTLIEMGVWYDEKDKKLIAFDIAQKQNEALCNLLAAALSAEEGDGFYWMDDYNPNAQIALAKAREALAYYEQEIVND